MYQNTVSRSCEGMICAGNSLSVAHDDSCFSPGRIASPLCVRFRVQDAAGPSLLTADWAWGGSGFRHFRQLKGYSRGQHWLEIPLSAIDWPDRPTFKLLHSKAAAQEELLAFPGSRIISTLLTEKFPAPPRSSALETQTTCK